MTVAGQGGGVHVPAWVHALALPQFDQVHQPIAHWAALRPDALALASESQQLSFAELHARIEQRAQALNAANAPATVLLPRELGVVDTLIEFLAVLAAGRCGAIGDPAWPDGVAHSVQAAIDGLPPHSAESPGTAPFYVGFTSGSSGSPKGFRRHHLSWVESFRVSLSDFGADMAGRVIAPGRMTHSLFLFGAMLGLWTGAGAVVQERFSAERALHDLAGGDALHESSGKCALRFGMSCEARAAAMAVAIARTSNEADRPNPQMHTALRFVKSIQGTVLVAVPSQLLLLLQMAQRRQIAPIEHVRLVLISGARWMREHTPRLRALFPQARIVEFYGASEASYIAWMDADENAPAQAVGRPFSTVQLRIGEHPGQPVPPGQTGRIWMRSPMLFMDYVHATDGSAAVYEDGWLSVRDVGWLDGDGLLHLGGRESRMVVTQGKNLFPEEVEARLQAHPAITHASVLGMPDALRGMRVHAVLGDEPGGADLPDAQALAGWCREALEAYKAPRHWWRWQGPWPQTRSGKTDHAAIEKALQARLDEGAQADSACGVSEGLVPWC